ncbi:MAG: O-antigen ligase family protein [Chloroflexota bacterium]
MTPDGYPQQVIYVVLLVGLPLAFLQPVKAFAMCTIALVARNVESATFTRTSVLGPYFNLDDVLLVICCLTLVALVLRQRIPILIPRPALLLLVVWVIGSVNSIWSSPYGPSYEILREMRWSLTLPLTFIVAANLVTSDEKRIESFLKALFLGSVLASVQHFAFVSGVVGEAGDVQANLFRTIALMGAGMYFVIAEIVQPSPIKGRSRISHLAYYAALGAFGVSLVLNQTRSLWIGFIVSIPLLVLVLRRPHAILRSIAVGTVTVVLAFAITTLTLPHVDLTSVVGERVQSLVDEDQRVLTTETRVSAFEELEYWYEGNWLIGRGAAYHFSMGLAQDRTVAWGHLGYVTYLVRLGLIGLVAYGIFLPLVVIARGRRLIRGSSGEWGRSLAAVTLAVILLDSVAFLMSSSYLQSMPVSGLVFGALWGASSRLGNEPGAAATSPGRWAKSSMSSVRTRPLSHV